MQERHNRESVDKVATHNENQEAHQGGGSAVGSERYIVSKLNDPNALQADNNEQVISDETPAALTISKITVSLDIDTEEVAGDLKYADTFIDLANPVVINAFDTTSGVLSDDSITDGTVPVGKAIYLSFDSAPSADITQMLMTIYFTWD